MSIFYQAASKRIRLHSPMALFTLVLAVALPIACICLGSTQADSTLTSSFFQAECKEQQYYQNSSSVSCTSHLNSAHDSQQPAPHGFAKRVEDCEQLPNSTSFSAFHSIPKLQVPVRFLLAPFSKERTGHQSLRNASDFKLKSQSFPYCRGVAIQNLTEIDIIIRREFGCLQYDDDHDKERSNAAIGGGLHFALCGSWSYEPNTNLKPMKGVLTNRDRDDGHHAVQSTDSGLLTLSALILTAIVVSLVCALGRRPYPFAQEGWQWPRWRRSDEEQSAAHFRTVPQGDELGQPRVGEDVEFYDQNQGRPAGNEDAGHEELVALIEFERFNPAPAAPAQAQQPGPDRRGVEDLVPLDPNEVAALLANNIDDINETAAPAAEREEDNFVGIISDVAVHGADEPNLEGDNDDNDPGDPNESDKDRDEDEAHDRDVPQFPAAERAEDNPVARISNYHPQLF